MAGLNFVPDFYLYSELYARQQRLERQLFAKAVQGGVGFDRLLVHRLGIARA
jgi:hypothetical protein